MDIENLQKRFPEHWEKATALRMLSIDAVQKANSGHPGMPMGMADVATVLFSKHLKFYSKYPNWPDRDRFILSAGHGSMLLYSLLFLSGYKDIELNDIINFRKIGSKTAGHPEFGHVDGIETTTGPLGQGLSNAVGFALAEEIIRARWGSKICNHKTYVVVGDGCLMEGISQEAISFAGKQKLENLIVLWDDNGITIDGELSKSCVTDQTARFSASGWSVFRCDGHDPESIDEALNLAKKSDLPSFIKCTTKIGFGSPNKEGKASSHGAPLGEDEIKKVRANYNWKYDPFVIPDHLTKAWGQIGSKSENSFKEWEYRFTKLSKTKRLKFMSELRGDAPNSLGMEIRKLKKSISEERPSMATRKSSEQALTLINDLMANTLGGSADLTGSNNTLTNNLGTFDASNRLGRYIYYGIREHAMAAIMNGIALHGGMIPYGGTFMAFADYARGGMRLSAIMGLGVIYVMTHDSIGLGEDGPTHQPVEHLAMLRATPNMVVLRPADTIETIEAWEIAIKNRSTPSVLALSRQSLPTLRVKHSQSNLSSKGAYVLQKATASRKVILLASGSELEIAVEAKKQLEINGIGTAVVSFPSWELFEKQDESYRKKVLPRGPVRVAIEAGVINGWERWLYGERGSEKKSAFVGMTGFGASGSAKELYNHFEITCQTVVNKVKDLLTK